MMSDNQFGPQFVVLKDGYYLSAKVGLLSENGANFMGF